MKTKILIQTIFLFFISCKSQSTYKESTLIEQSEIINNLQKQQTQSKKILTIGDLVSSLKVPIIEYGFSTKSWDDNDNVDFIKLRFHTIKEFHYKMDNNINLHTINITLKKDIKYDEVLSLTRKNKAKWTKEVNDYFKDMEVDSVRAE